MTLGNFTRATLEARATEQLNRAIDGLYQLMLLDERCAVELAAGTLDTADFYEGDTVDKANILGMLDQAAATYAWLTGGGNVAAPSGDPMAYAKSMIGLG